MNEKVPQSRMTEATDAVERVYRNRRAAIVAGLVRLCGDFFASGQSLAAAHAVDIVRGTRASRRRGWSSRPMLLGELIGQEPTLVDQYRLLLDELDAVSAPGD
jgi:hypothetical protein